MARTYPTRTIALPLEIYEALKRKKNAERRYGSFNSYICQILDGHLRWNARSENAKDIAAIRVRRVTTGEQQRKTG